MDRVWTWLVIKLRGRTPPFLPTHFVPIKHATLHHIRSLLFESVVLIMISWCGFAMPRWNHPKPAVERRTKKKQKQQEGLNSCRRSFLHRSFLPLLPHPPILALHGFSAGRDCERCWKRYHFPPKNDWRLMEESARSTKAAAATISFTAPNSDQKLCARAR